MKEKILSFIGLSMLVLLSSFALQAKAVEPIDDSSAGMVDVTNATRAFYETFPQVSIDDIDIPSHTYKAGDSIKGTFAIKNGKNFDVPDVSYKISLVGYTGSSSVASVVYDTVKGPQLYLKANEIKSQSFSYTLPANAKGSNMGLQIGAVLKNGIDLGWTNARITVTGGKGLLQFSDSFIEANGKTYSLQAGPTIEKGGNVFFNAELKNTTDQNIVINPVLKIHTFSSSEEPQVFKAASFEVGKGEVGTPHIELPVFDYTPAVYVGEMSFLDESGAKIAATLDFRYIIGGDIINFQSISSDSTTLNKGNRYKVSLSYTGSPFNIDSQFSLPKENNADLLVKIFNEKNQLVSQQITTNYNFNEGVKVEIPLVAEAASKALRAEVTATKEGEVVSRYNADLSSDYRAAQQKAQKEADQLQTILVIVGAVILLGVLFLVIKYTKRKSVPTIIALIIVSAGLLSYHKADAFTITSAWVKAGLRDQAGCTGAYVSCWSWQTLGTGNGVVMGNDYMQSSGDGYISHSQGSFVPLAPGEIFDFGGSLVALACGNADTARVVVKVTYQGVTRIDDLSQTTGSSGRVGLTFNYLAEGFQVTGATFGGTQRIYVEIITYNGTDKWADVQGYEDFSIVSQPSVSLSASPNPAPYNGATTLTWTTSGVGGATCVDGVNSCLASGDWNGPVGPAAGGSLARNNIVAPMTYNLMCYKLYHGYCVPSNTASVAVTAQAQPTISVTLNANPSTGSAPLTSETLTANATVSGLNPVNNQYSFRCSGGSSWSAYSASNSYTSCVYGSAGTYTASVQVRNNNMYAQGDAIITVTSASLPAVSLTANPSSVDYNQASTLTWVSQNVTTCSGTNFSPGGLLNGSVSTGALTAARTYTISCTGPGGTVTSSVTVNVNPLSFTCQPENPQVPGVRIVQAPVGMPVKWVVKNGPAGATYTWGGTSPLSGTGSSVTVTYQTIGKKTAAVTAAGQTAQCDANAFNISAQPGYKEF